MDELFWDLKLCPLQRGLLLCPYLGESTTGGSAVYNSPACWVPNGVRCGQVQTYLGPPSIPALVLKGSLPMIIIIIMIYKF